MRLGFKNGPLESGVFEYSYNRKNDRWIDTGAPLLILFVIITLSFMYFAPNPIRGYIPYEKYSPISVFEMVVIPQIMFLIGPLLVILFQRKSVPIFHKLGFTNWDSSYIVSMLKLELLICLPLLAISCLMTLFFNKLGISISSYGAELLLHSGLGGKITIIFFAVFIAPVIEEFAFRRVLFVFIGKYLGNFHSAVLVSIIFASMHGSINQIIPLAILSMILCNIYSKFNSIYPCIFLHSFNNIFMIILFFMTQLKY